MEYQCVQKERTPVCSPFARLLQCGPTWTARPHTQKEDTEQTHDNDLLPHR